MNESSIIRIAPFGMDLIISSYYLAAPLLLIEFGANTVELGLIGSITSAVHMLLAHRIGPLSDHFGRRRVILLSPLLLFSSCLFAGITTRVGMILILSAINGLSLSLFWPAFQAWVAELKTGSGIARDIGTLNMAWTASHLVGPIISGFMFNFHPRLPFFFAAAISSAIFILSYKFIRDHPLPEKEKELWVEDLKPSSWKNFLYASWIANFMSWFILGNARYQFPKLARELGSSPQVVGILIGSLGFSLFMGFLFLRRSDIWHFRKLYLLGSQVLGALGLFIIYMFSSTILFTFALALIGFSASVTYYSSLLYAIRLSPKKGRGTGFHESILSLGGLIGPILGGLSAYFFNLRTPYLICLFFLLSAIIYEVKLFGKKRSSTS